MSAERSPMSAAMKTLKKPVRTTHPALREDLYKLLGLTVVFVLAILLTACASGAFPLTVG